MFAKSLFFWAILLMRLCIFAEVEFLAAITTFELFSSFFHAKSPPCDMNRNGCATPGPEHMAQAWELCFIFAKEIPSCDPFSKLAHHGSHAKRDDDP
jgi:hypothetical protein